MVQKWVNSAVNSAIWVRLQNIKYVRMSKNTEIEMTRFPSFKLLSISRFPFKNPKGLFQIGFRYNKMVEWDTPTMATHEHFNIFLFIYSTVASRIDQEFLSVKYQLI